MKRSSSLPVTGYPPAWPRRRTVWAILSLAALGTTACGRKGAGRPSGAVPAPFSYTLLDGVQHQSRELQGQVVLVNFWATSCAICMREMPRFVATQRQFGARGLQTLAVAVQQDAPALVASYAQSRQLPFGVAIDNTGAIAQAFGGVRGTPTTLLLDRSGRVVWHHEGEPDFDALHARLEALLGAPGPVGA